MKDKSEEKIKVVAVGVGHRTEIYCQLALKKTEDMEIVGVAEPDRIRREKFSKTYNIPTERQYDNYESLCQQEKFADAAINGTMDEMHYQSTMALIKAGYDVLLEKPICKTLNEVIELLNTAKKLYRKIMICHVLRYAPFYVEIKKRILAGEIGKIRAIHTSENVWYTLFVTSFVRGKWSRREVNPVILAKCCHDLDIIAWMMSGVQPRKVASFGGLNFFNQENLPAGAGNRCVTDCEIEHNCPYSAKRLFIDNNYHHLYPWSHIEHIDNPTEEDKINSLATDNPHGKCVWRCDNSVADVQSLIVEFENGAVVSHDLYAAAPYGRRCINIQGTMGEIEGNMEEGHFVIRHSDPDNKKRYIEENVEVKVKGDMHGGGDFRLVEDFISLMRGNAPSISCTNIEDSITGHAIAFAAIEAMDNSSVVNIKNYC